MTNSDKQSATPYKIPKGLLWAFIITSFIGFLDASYLAAAHYTGIDLVCSLIEGCDKVTTSEYSVVYGIPVALGGVFYYFSILFLSLLYLDTKKTKIINLIPPLTIIGIAASIYFVYLQVFIIKAICEYCMLSAITSTLLFVFGVVAWTKMRNNRAL